MAVTTTPLRAVASSRMTMSSVAWPFQTISLVSYPMMETVITSLVFRLLSLNFPSMSVVSPVDPPLTKTAAPMTGPLASLTVPLTEPPLFWAPAAAENDTNRATAATTAAIPLNIEDLILFNIILKYWFYCVVCQCVCTFSSFLFRLFRFFISSVSSVFSASFFSFAFVVSTVSSTSFPLFFCRSFRLFRFSRFLPLLLPSHLPSSGFFCSFHLFLSLLFKSPVNFACSWYLSQLMSPLSTSFAPKLGQS